MSSGQYDRIDAPPPYNVKPEARAPARFAFGATMATLAAFPLFAIGLQSVWIGAGLAIALTCLLATVAWGLGRSGLVSARSAFGWLLLCQLIACGLIWMWAAGQIE
jgi:hypothetical protein